jgi:hypothetical protein
MSAHALRLLSRISKPAQTIAGHALVEWQQTKTNQYAGKGVARLRQFETSLPHSLDPGEMNGAAYCLWVTLVGM